MAEAVLAGNRCTGPIGRTLAVLQGGPRQAWPGRATHCDALRRDTAPPDPVRGSEAERPAGRRVNKDDDGRAFVPARGVWPSVAAEPRDIPRRPPRRGKGTLIFLGTVLVTFPTFSKPFF